MTSNVHVLFIQFVIECTLKLESTHGIRSGKGFPLLNKNENNFMGRIGDKILESGHVLRATFNSRKMA